MPEHPTFLNYVPGGIAAATVTALAVGVSYRVFRRLAERRLAVAATLGLAFATAVWSISADAMWTHGLTHLTLMAGVLASAAGHQGRAGLAFGASVFTRPHTAVVAAVMGIWSGVSQRRVAPTLWMGLTSFLGVLALALYSQWLFGTWIPVAGYPESRAAGVVTTPWLLMGERLLLSLVHPLRGVFVYTPVLLVLLPFVRHGWRGSPLWVRSSAVGGIAYLLVQLRVNTWTGGGDFFGSRLTIETIVLVSPLLLRTWQTAIISSERLKGAVVGLLVAGAIVHGYGALNPITREAREGREAGIREFCDERTDIEACADYR